MLRSNREKQQAYEFVSIEELVPQDHLLRKVDKYIDFSFIDEKVRPLYCVLIMGDQPSILSCYLR